MIVFGEAKIKYDHLDQILSDVLSDIRFKNTVNVIIDLKEILRKIYRPNVLTEEEVYDVTVEEISSDIIGIVSHYRNYLYKEGKYSSFYFIYSRSECEIMKDKYSDYKREYYKKYFYDPEREKRISAVDKAVNIASKIINQVPNCLFVDSSKFDEYVTTKFLIEKLPKNQVNLILTNDEIMAQLVDKNTFILNLKGITSNLIDETNAPKLLYKVETDLSTKMIPLISAMAGTERYNLEKIPRVGPSRSIKIMEHLIKEDIIMDTFYMDFPIKLESLNPKNKQEKLVIDNYKIIKTNYDIISNTDVLYKNQTELTIMFNQPNRAQKMNHFLELNSKLFVNYPLHLSMLLKGESLK